jgi:GT2 family glycosyltransferase
VTAPDYTVVIATLDREASLEKVLACLAAQTHAPRLVVVADASTGPATRELVARWTSQLAIRHLPCAKRSAAIQRNAGAALAVTPLVAFMDDDIAFPSDLLLRLTRVFADSANVVGVSARESGAGHPAPGPLLRLYYRMQAGYSHPHYGARLFGVAINCFPCYACEAGELVSADWLPSGCVVYRRDTFVRELFPEFEEYSFMEDVHLSARMSRHGQLFFHAGAAFDHFPGESAFKRNVVALAHHRVHNRVRVAREVMQLRGWRLGYRVLLYRLFVTAALLRSRPPGWSREIAGTWG